MYVSHVDQLRSAEDRVLLRGEHATCQLVRTTTRTTRAVGVSFKNLGFTF